MLSETLSEGLEAYHIGPRVRALRLSKALSLAELGEHTSLSAGMLSKIERGQVFPTLPTLLRIAMVFDVGLDHFFSPESGRRVLAVVRRADRIALPNATRGEAAYTFESLDFPVRDRSLSTYLAEFAPGAAASAPHAHAGIEVIYVMAGTLVLDVEGEQVELGEGDAVHFDSGAAHSYRGAGAVPCRALVVVAQPAAE